MKKVGNYIIITILMLLGLLCVGILYLFFVPNSTLFNIAYINHHETISSEKYSVSTINEIKVISRSYDVNLKAVSTDNFYVSVDSRTFGFVHKKHEKVKITPSIVNNVLIIEVSEPYGLCSTNDSEITLFVPNTKDLDISLENKDAITTFNDKSLNINDLTYSTKSGDLNLRKATISGDLNLKLNSGTCTFYKDVKTNSNNVKLSLTSGDLISEKTPLGDITILKNNRGTINVTECKTIRENISSAGGQITVKKLSHINVKASDTIIKINEIEDGAIIDLVGSGSTQISTLKGNSSITTNSGNIKITNCLSSATLHSDDGDITVNKAMKTISTKTNYGDIYIEFDENADHYSASAPDKSRTIYATIHNGKLTAKGVEHVGSYEADSTQGIVVTGKGRINLFMNDVCGENTIKGKNGNVKIIVNHSSVYKLTTNPEAETSGNVRVNLMQISQYIGYTSKGLKETYVNSTQDSYGDNTLTVSTTTGDLTILDSKLS